MVRTPVMCVRVQIWLGAGGGRVVAGDEVKMRYGEGKSTTSLRWRRRWVVRRMARITSNVSHVRTGDSRWGLYITHRALPAGLLPSPLQCPPLGAPPPPPPTYTAPTHPRPPKPSRLSRRPAHVVCCDVV